MAKRRRAKRGLAVPQGGPEARALERVKRLTHGKGRGFFFFRNEAGDLTDEDLEVLSREGWLEHRISYYDPDGDEWPLDPETDAQEDPVTGRITWHHEGEPISESEVGESWITTDKLDDARPSPQEAACTCIHDRDVHDPETGACLYTNPNVGPCPCEATPETTRKALWAAHEKLREALRDQAR